MEQLRSCSWEQFEHSWRTYVGKTRSVGLRTRWLTGNVEGGSHFASVYVNGSDSVYVYGSFKDGG